MFPEYRYVLRLNNDGYANSGKAHQFYWWANALGIKPDQLQPDDFILKLKHNPLAISGSPYIVVQPSTITWGKDIEAIRTVGYPLPVYGVGMLNEYKHENWIDYRGHSLTDVAYLIDNPNCKLFVGINSAITILASMLGKPTIMCHFSMINKTGDVFARESGVSTMFPGNVDLITPGESELQTVINYMLRKNNGNKI